MDPVDLVTIYALYDPMKAEIIRNYLDDEGVRAFINGANQAAEPGLSAIEIEIQVAAADAERAMQLIADHKAESEFEDSDIDFEDTAADDEAPASVDV